MFNLNKRIIRQALDLSPVATIIMDVKTHPKPVVYVNQAFEALSGYDAGELIGHPWAELLTEDHPDVGDATELKPGSTLVLNAHPRLGATETLTLEMLPLYDRPGTPRYWVGTEQALNPVTTDETDAEREAVLAVLRDARMHLRRLDGRDSSTGILNRRAFDDLMQRDWVMARREKRNMAVIVFRADGFQAYREVYGRHAADSCLCKVAHAITGSLRRGGDLAARYSDDQFVVLVGNADEKGAQTVARHVADKVRGLSIHHPRSPVDRFVTVSFGVAVAVPDMHSAAQSLIDAALEDLGAAVEAPAGLSAI